MCGKFDIIRSLCQIISPEFVTPVVHLRDGRFGLVEVKLGGEALIDEGAATLTSLANSVDSEKMKKPSFRMVLTAVGDFAYTRPTDGVVVCPISALRP